ncbi:TIGR02285 family protein [Andreprevotia chitinilytica]|uniref:TIGR02285 family protein n=1 Tax=Andreprevotia chitinilytica TaxID=396808 RepID=UPI0005594BA4|nr:TIGR02285 family protein [Andreprevotia chitinilytica]
MRVLLTLCLLFTAVAAGSGEPREITWVLIDWPPLYIVPPDGALEGPSSLGDGISDRASTLLAAKLPQYHHHFVRTDLQRLWGEIEHGHNLCYLSALRTPQREKLAYFTPSFVLPPLNLVLRKDQANRISATGQPVVLANLLNHAELKGAFATKRSYSSEVDVLIDQAGNKTRRIAEPVSGRILRLIDAGQLDYTLEYPIVVAYHQKLKPFEHELITLPLAEIPDILTANVACTRNGWGKQAIQDIDAALIELSANEAFRNIVTPWLTADVVLRVRPRFEAFYNGRKQPLRLAD